MIGDGRVYQTCVLSTLLCVIVGGVLLSWEVLLIATAGARRGLVQSKTPKTLGSMFNSTKTRARLLPTMPEPSRSSDNADDANAGTSAATKIAQEEDQEGAEAALGHAAAR